MKQRSRGHGSGFPSGGIHTWTGWATGRCSQRRPGRAAVTARGVARRAGRLVWKDARGTTRFNSVVIRDVSETGAYVESVSGVADSSVSPGLAAGRASRRTGGAAVVPAPGTGVVGGVSGGAVQPVDRRARGVRPSPARGAEAPTRWWRRRHSQRHVRGGDGVALSSTELQPPRLSGPASLSPASQPASEPTSVPVSRSASWKPRGPDEGSQASQRRHRILSQPDAQHLRSALRERHRIAGRLRANQLTERVARSPAPRRRARLVGELQEQPPCSGLPCGAARSNAGSAGRSRAWWPGPCGRRALHAGAAARRLSRATVRGTPAGRVVAAAGRQTPTRRGRPTTATGR